MADTDHLESNCPILLHSVVLKVGRLTSSNVDTNIPQKRRLPYGKEENREHPVLHGKPTRSPKAPPFNLRFSYKNTSKLPLSDSNSNAQKIPCRISAY